MTNATRTEETRRKVFAVAETEQRIQAAELAGARRDMELMARLEYYGSDVLAAMAWNDVRLFKMSAALCRPAGK